MMQEIFFSFKFLNKYSILVGFFFFLINVVHVVDLYVISIVHFLPNHRNQLQISFFKLTVMSRHMKVMNCTQNQNFLELRSFCYIIDPAVTFRMTLLSVRGVFT